MNRASIGLAGEESAALYLEKKGYVIKGRRVRIGHSEIDLIACGGGCTVFVEVKTRRMYPESAKMGRYSSPGAAVDSKKSAYLIRAAEEYIRSLGENADGYFRIDVIEVYADPDSDEYRVLEIRHTENAVRKKSGFSYRGYR